MTIQDVINRVTVLRNERRCTTEFIVEKINEIEWKIKREIIDTHEGAANHPFDGYTAAELNVKLIAPEPYSDVYIKWVIYQLDVLNNAMTDAANSYALFNNIYDEYKGWYNRNNMPVYHGNITSRGYHV